MAGPAPLRLEGNFIFWASGWPYFSLLSFALSRYLFCEQETYSLTVCSMTVESQNTR